VSLSPRWLGLSWSRLSSVQRAILVSAAAFVVWFFVATCKDAENFHGVDLRPKVLGARAMLAGLNPYNYVWKPGMSERLLDPWRRHPGPTRTTYPPPLLLFYAPLANVAYTTQRLFWFGAEWAAMLATTVVAARLSTGRRARVWFFGVAGFAFIGNWFFRLHVERGQYYVFVALLLALALADLLEGRERLRTALVLGVTVALRPTFGLVPLLLFFAGKRRLAITTLGVAAALCLATVPLVGVSGWRGYLALVRYHQGFGGADIGRDFGPEIHVPRKAEGLELVDCLPHNGANVSFNALYGEIRAVPLFRDYAKAA
jgi:hypothetical protein